MTEFQRFQIEAARWADATFGLSRSPKGPVAHLVKEVRELSKNPFDDMEYADCLMLLLDAAGNAGISADNLLNACWEKLEINRQRQWGEQDTDGVVEHIRETYSDTE